MSESKKGSYPQILKNSRFSPPSDWMQIETIDNYTGGEPLRVKLKGFPALKGRSVLEYRRDCKENHDHLRTALMFEPRGHADMYGCLLTPPNDSQGDFGIIFMHNEGYSTMCGHAIIAISKLTVELNWIPVVEGENELKIDAPCGRILSYVNVYQGKVSGIYFYGVPSFVVALDRIVDIKGVGKVTYDLAYGGAFYAYVDMAKNNFRFDLNEHHYQDIINYGTRIKQSVMAADQDITHPFESDLSFLYGTIFTEKRENDEPRSRNICVFAEGEVDRSPTGSGVAGRVAIHHKRNELNYNETMTFESITGSTFKGSIHKVVTYGGYSAVIPKVEGNAFITGCHTFVFDPQDPVKSGFILR